jgi:hypothetical protein
MEEQEAAVEHLRDFMRSSYLTGNQVARRIGVRDTTILFLVAGEKYTEVCYCCAYQRLPTLPSGGASGHHAGRVRVSGIQELARNFEAEELSVL